MGILGDIFGSSSSSNTTKNENSNTSSQSTTNTSQTQNTDTTQQTTATGQATSSTLDAATIDQVKGLISQLSGNGGQSAAATASLGGLGDLITKLTTRADAMPGQLQSTIAANQAAAKQNFALTTQAQINQAQQQVGSKFGNSFSQLLQSQGNNQLEVNLAKIASDAGLQNTAQQSQDFATIANLAAQLPAQTVNAEASQANTLSSLLGILKGANTTSNTQDQSTTTLNQLVSALLNSQAMGTSQTQSQTTANTTSATDSLFERLPFIIGNTIKNAGPVGIATGTPNSAGSGTNTGLSGLFDILNGAKNG